jgi:hypothetical protein
MAGAYLLGDPMATARTDSGVEYDPLALDATEARFWHDLWDAVPDGAAAEHGIERASFGPLQATVVRELGDAQMINLLLGATAPEAVAEGHLEAGLEWGRERGVAFTVQVPPGEPETDAAEAALRAAGFAPAYGWMRFVRDVHPPRFSPSEEVEVVELTAPDQEPFGAIAATAFGLPAWGAELFASLPGRPGWRCYVGKLDGAAQAAGAMFLDGEVAELGIGATVEPARGRGAQLTLLHHRIADAAAAGARLLFVETGERVPGRPSTSYGNILRAGFEEAYVCPNWAAPGSETAA